MVCSGDLPGCEKMDGPECGQPSSQYWGKALCYSKYIQHKCPAMCGVCAGNQLASFI